MRKLDARAVGARLREARQAAGLTQSRLAERAGMEVQSLSRLERGEYEPSLSSAAALAEALGTSLDELVLGRQPGQQASGSWRAIQGARAELLKTILALQSTVDSLGSEDRAPSAHVLHYRHGLESPRRGSRKKAPPAWTAVNLPLPERK